MSAANNMMCFGVNDAPGAGVLVYPANTSN